MKIGQMASYVDDGLSPAVRRTLARLQDSVPPMSAELAAGVVAEELGLPPGGGVRPLGSACPSRPRLSGRCTGL